MAARAATAQVNGERILAAAAQLFGEQLYDQVSLDEVAALAGVTVRTVVRRFGSKLALFDTVAEERALSNRRAREQAPVGEVDQAVRILVDTYERWGDLVVHLLAQERRTAAIGNRVAAGRRYHRIWVKKTLSPLLGNMPPALTRRRLAELTAVTDVYVWKVLRRDLGLSRSGVEASVGELVKDIIARGS